MRKPISVVYARGHMHCIDHDKMNLEQDPGKWITSCGQTTFYHAVNALPTCKKCIQLEKSPENRTE